MNKYLVKLAKASELKPHQEEALAKLDKNKGIILHHGTGSGKSFLFLTAAKKALDENKTDDALIIAPASLTTNVDKELLKHKIKLDRSRLKVLSYERAANISDELAKNKHSLVVLDEAHKMRNTGTKRHSSLADIVARGEKRILATATANYNNPHDLSSLVNMAAGYEALPTDKKDFEKRYIGKIDKPRSLVDRVLGRPAEQEDRLVRTKELGALFKDHLHHYDPKEDPAAKDKFPAVTEKNVEVEMSPEQHKYYKYLEGQIPFWLRMKIRNNLPLDKKEKSQLNAFSQGVRQSSNSYRHLLQDRDSAEYTPKIKEAVKNLESSMKGNKNFRGLVYSNYLDSGVEEYSRVLTEKGIKHNLFTGALSTEEKDRVKEEYNTGKVPILLVSSSGAEGLDLKGTRKVQILEPHYNHSKIRQVVGRGSRYESHEHLPQEERTMEVEHYLSTHPKGLFGKPATSIDKYLHQMSDDKSVIFDQIKQVMKDNS